LTAVGNGKKVAARLTGKAEGKGRLYRELTKKAKELQDASPEHEAAEKEKTVIFNWFLAAPDSDVVEVRVIRE
ncbi:MAG: formylmethanofuran dehydrogenase, partial [Spirochaetes bacterium]|nr:formylmethanofuran dehydrogenase [Spirochaetota bacterium]